MEISIIIPAYNVEKYISKCIESCINYNFNYEIIIVNDGSSDATQFIAERYEKEYTNIRLISQENQGLSMARNNGLDISCGEYVWFIDSDDWLVEGALQGIVQHLSLTKPDILQLQYQLAFEDGKTKCVYPCLIENVQTGPEIILKGGLPVPAQFCIYRREFLLENNLRFFPNIYHEDSEFKPRATYFAKSIISYDKVVYNYLQRHSGSITSSFKLKNAQDIIIVNINLYKFIKESVSDSNLHCYFYRCISRNFNTLFVGMRQLDIKSYKEVVRLLQENKHLLISMLKSKTMKYVIEGLFFCINIRLGLCLHNKIR